MTLSQLADIRKAFDAYAACYADADRRLPPLLQLKVDHSRRVAVEARDLSAELGWPASRCHAMDALGLLHDVGRFSQFAEFRTFSDSASVDHGERGWRVARQADWLSALQPGERAAILAGIRYHNRRVVPEGLHPRALAFVRAVRDADKLDIFHVVLDAVERDGFRDLPDMLPHVSLDRAPSPGVVADVLRRRSGLLKHVKSLGDFLAMQMAWVHDLNYAPAFERLRERRILPRIRAQLEGGGEVQRLYEAACRAAESTADRAAAETEREHAAT